MPIFRHDGIDFHYRETGAGTPFVFQHGLGGDVNQPFGVFRPPPGFRMISLDCRAHGQTTPVGDENKIDVRCSADDLVALLDYLQIRSTIIGGISMGAAIALTFALTYPERVIGLVLSRPAWLDQPRAAGVEIFSRIAQFIRRYGAAEGAERFKESEYYVKAAQESPDAAASLLAQFAHPRAEETVAKLERIPAHTPAHSREQWATLHVPTLVLANRQDPIHPFEYGTFLADTIPGAVFGELTTKSVSVEQHTAYVQKHLSDFLTERFPKR